MQPSLGQKSQLIVFFGSATDSLDCVTVLLHGTAIADVKAAVDSIKCEVLCPLSIKHLLKQTRPVCF